MRALEPVCPSPNEAFVGGPGQAGKPQKISLAPACSHLYPCRKPVQKYRLIHEFYGGWPGSKS